MTIALFMMVGLFALAVLDYYVESLAGKESKGSGGGFNIADDDHWKLVAHIRSKAMKGATKHRHVYLTNAHKYCHACGVKRPACKYGEHVTRTGLCRSCGLFTSEFEDERIDLAGASECCKAKMIRYFDKQRSVWVARCCGCRGILDEVSDVAIRAFDLFYFKELRRKNGR